MTTMHVKTFMTVAQMLPANVSILLRGNHGIGKSQVVRQVARKIAEKEGLEKFEIIDRRLSQMSEGDMIGLPSTDGEVTRFNPPEWYKRACDTPCCLFLDELNRATHEVMQAAFQIVLDRELNGWKLHPDTRVFSAVNSSAAYTVNEIDPALLDRFWCIDLDPTVEDWTNWARGEGGVHPTIVDFIANQEKFLDPPKNGEPGHVQPSRRSYERLSNALTAAGIADEPNNDLFYQMSLGYIGTEAAIALVAFAKTVDNRFSGKDIVESYMFDEKVDKKTKKSSIVENKGEVKRKVERIGQEGKNIAIDKVAEYIMKNCESVNELQGSNLKAFMHDLPHELRVSCWTKLTANGVDKLELAKSLHKWCVEEILDVFGVPMGEAGVGIQPNIPGIFTANKDKK